MIAVQGPEMPLGTYIFHDIANQWIHIEVRHGDFRKRTVFADDTPVREIMKTIWTEYSRLVEMAVVTDLLEKP